jgi:hypothetical protein
MIERDDDQLVHRDLLRLPDDQPTPMLPRCGFARSAPTPSRALGCVVNRLDAQTLPG